MKRARATVSLGPVRPPRAFRLASGAPTGSKSATFHRRQFGENPLDHRPALPAIPAHPGRSRAEAARWKQFPKRCTSPTRAFQPGLDILDAPTFRAVAFRGEVDEYFGFTNAPVRKTNIRPAWTSPARQGGAHRPRSSPGTLFLKTEGRSPFPMKPWQLTVLTRASASVSTRLPRVIVIMVALRPLNKYQSGRTFTGRCSAALNPPTIPSTFDLIA